MRAFTVERQLSPAVTGPDVVLNSISLAAGCWVHVDHKEARVRARC